MKFKIKNLATLIAFIDKSFDQISDHDFNDICLSTMGVYTNGKASTKEETITKVTEFWNYVNSQPANAERPLFIIYE